MQAWLSARVSQQQTETVAPADAELLLMFKGRKRRRGLCGNICLGNDQVACSCLRLKAEFISSQD